MDVSSTGADLDNPLPHPPALPSFSSATNDE